ncbi:MAG: YdiU family protein [Candidatus Eremiobacteraeota bacterium]|nr:YdiU family protein [Candidatus Eremiobacteraeota bacterium]
MQTSSERAFDTLIEGNAYAALPPAFFVPTAPTPLRDPYLVAVSRDAAREIGVPVSTFERPHVIRALAGSDPLPGVTPIAAAYAGHQFGSWVPQLGDGRALLLGNVRTRDGALWELQLKGAGETAFSRMGDGRAVLRSTIREFLCSEAMDALGVPTTRALAIVGSDDAVYRETAETAAVLTRLAPSFVRFGTFEFFFARGDADAQRTLADWLIERYFPTLVDAPNRYEAFLCEVVERTARTIAHWQSIGFQHGVMNTDNMSILGLTLDYGPFGFMEAYDPDWICNHSDHLGRYRFSAQPSIGLWNLRVLAAALEPLVVGAGMTRALERYEPALRAAYVELCRKKMGLIRWPDDRYDLLGDLLALMGEEGADYTLTFRALSSVARSGDAAAFLSSFGGRAAAAAAWLAQYRDELGRQGIADEDRLPSMRAVNPAYILRNHLAHVAITRAQQRDFSEVDRLLAALRSPFDERPEFDDYAQPAPAWAASLELSCSS